MSNVFRPKTKESQWTDEQWKAIVADGRDILVAAAAGSGKTAVLVERIIQKITAKEDPVDVDRLLVVTFTNASASEMKTRIAEAIERELDKQPNSLHLRRQLSLLNRASISTIHSFCLDVVRKYYYLIDIDPVFRIADDTEAELLKEEVMEELLEEEYGKADNEPFFDIVDRYTGDRSDAELQEMILAIHEFSQSHPEPCKWLDQLVAMYDVDENDRLEEIPYISWMKRYVKMELDAAKRLVSKALQLANLPGGPLPRAENYRDDLRIIAHLETLLERSWDELYEAFQSLSLSRLKSCRGDEYDPQLLEEANSLRDQAKKKLESLRDNVFSLRPATWLHHMREMKPIVETIVRLVKRFAEMFQARKREKGIVDFSDLEHYCLQILRHPDSADGQWLPSDAALDYRAQFIEVLVDEYQDTNMVQEAILQLVAKGGNLFMVGDVKQSIYRFRLAEPLLFLSKYKRFTADGTHPGMKIDLSNNFRSRAEVLHGTNFIFKQIMGETVGEIEYDETAELKYGAVDYPDSEHAAPELIVIDRNSEEGEESGELDANDLAAAQLEARMMAKKIKEIVSEPLHVFDRKAKRMRRAMYRDIVILLRSMTAAPQIMEEFRAQGIPVYADLSSGYFQATEIAVMLSLLRVIDNPYQDIPLASVLRSPIVGLNENELALIRIHEKKGTFYEAMMSFLHKAADNKEEEMLQQKLRLFSEQLHQWRTMARQRSLADVIWQLYRDTHFYDFVGGLPGGKQRQANLRALYDRARQYEATSFRGLFRFLRFIERLQERGDDLGAARALGEQEDVVRIMTIHSSKGLEFPIVFVAGLARPFNTRDLYGSYLLDKELGFAARFVDPKLRISYPTLPQIAIRQKKRLDYLAEEMRILYVALTRAKEKLYLVAAVKDAQKEIDKWKSTAAEEEWLLPDDVRAAARCYLDWIGRALIRHRDGQRLGDLSHVCREVASHPSVWRITIVPARELHDANQETERLDEQIATALKRGERVPTGGYAEEVQRLLSWKYAYEKETLVRAKQAVSELKRHREIFGENADIMLLHSFSTPLFERPMFMREKTLTPAEKGTAMHIVMRHVDLTVPITEEAVREQIAKLVQMELLTHEQAEAVNVSSIVAFFDTEIGKRLRTASEVHREIPFSLALPAKEVYGDGVGKEGNILVQGVIDCLFADEKGLVLIDFKTDAVNRFAGGWREAKQVMLSRYQTQMQLYRRAVEQIWKMNVDECYLYLFDGSHLLPI
ncbi:helicase-exonuclease AddAB subunit AddA [Parageobacillus thermoglucosidasius]|uniref:helicase-exonuclease AddAB subunit AddA n=1 Tax=Parageobacillus thermoglucosidasius TaxID=1426 RepID=UPI000E140E96|nr:helicase-exonuclease AddAB subunit AddA [Parageobacillus thermoglucosidasius]MED4903070.1 helicase-exonuclease AddAB subunit AddA [Parageobacillus thermoglucosidasius]MED4915137.1 helicase-exonuclease AddAB subunit AddA [Parageobacillus thermoglucosidasius]MED4945974.1 helicase-exonuclease AddAB subunit AddA [Parageobacillus thermoglucosidasius]MED4981658.1 helicase-exonuclease AddAB subunit AddA [Parageobacillus thermoglucosidasius]RDE28843.1 helicase-exonuclease AddAB subunit AddA [Parage